MTDTPAQWVWVPAEALDAATGLAARLRTESGRERPIGYFVHSDALRGDLLAAADLLDTIIAEGGDDGS